MRRILFRGKAINLNNGSKDFVFGQYVQNRNGKFIYTDTWEEGINKYQVIEKTVGQYTGLTDINGIEIYEGDIVKAMYRIKYKEDYVLGTVVFENGTFKLAVVGTAKKGEFTLIASSIENYKKTSMYALENNFIFRGYSLEVIGNIHDNPELLKGGEE